LIDNHTPFYPAFYVKTAVGVYVSEYVVNAFHELAQNEATVQVMHLDVGGHLLSFHNKLGELLACEIFHLNLDRWVSW
jgi:hypothetical protein